MVVVILSPEENPFDDCLTLYHVLPEEKHTMQ